MRTSPLTRKPHPRDTLLMLSNIALKLTDALNERTGRFPANLARVLEKRRYILPEMPAAETCICAETVTRWDELGSWSSFEWPRRIRGQLIGWRQDHHNYRSFSAHRAEYSEIASLDVTEEWLCDISKVHGFAASKSELKKFQSMDQMVETNSREMISEISEAMLQANLAHDEIRLTHRNKSDYFMVTSWDERLFLINAGGSHHFAAAKYIAKRLPQAVPLRGKLHRFRLNERAISSLRGDYDMFLLSNEQSAWHEFSEALMSFRATWLWHEMPRPLKNTRAVLLPRSEQRSRCVARLLHEQGATDLGAHLAHIAQL